MRRAANLFWKVPLAALAAPCAFGCADLALPTDAATDGYAANFTTAAIERPFRGWITGELMAIPPYAPGSSDVCNANFSGDPTAPGPSISLFDVAYGHFMHMGRVELHAVSCVDPASPVSTGTGTISAANGDLLFITFENTSHPDPVDPSRLLVSGVQSVNGGTGRFQDATGEQLCTFTVALLSPSTAVIKGRCEGSVIY